MALKSLEQRKIEVSHFIENLESVLAKLSRQERLRMNGTVLRIESLCNNIQEDSISGKIAAYKELMAIFKKDKYANELAINAIRKGLK